ncbi:MAG: hypothetical protein Q4D60_07975 [Eubacteriales bacterium]|nr:hypothetical protein [Eubacteriales bacterium]
MKKEDVMAMRAEADVDMPCSVSVHEHKAERGCRFVIRLCWFNYKTGGYL